MKLSKINLILILGLAFSPNIFGGGTDFMTVSGARNFALNGLYTAGIDGANGVIWNPASLSSLTGFGLELIMSNKLGQHSFDSEYNGYFESFRDDDFNINGGSYWNLSPGLTIGLGYYPVLSYEVDWPFTLIRQKGTSSIILSYD